MDCTINLDDKIEIAKQHESFKQMLLRVLDDQQIQQKISALLHSSGRVGRRGINVPQRW